MLGRAPASALAMLLAFLPLAGGASENARPLRTLTYAVEVSTVEALEQHGPPAPAPPVMVVKGRQVSPPPQQTGSGQRRVGATVTTTGTITLDVIRATDDAGLIVEISEDATKWTKPKVRVGVASDGALFYDPKSAPDLSEEELAVLRWLGRGFYGDHPTQVGTSWTVDQSSNGHTDVERYRVLANEAGRVTLDYHLEERANGPGAFAGNREGSLVYDTSLIVPVKAAFQGLARRQLGEGYDTLRTFVKLTLTADTFAKR